MRQTKEQKRIAAAIEAAFNKNGKNIQFNMMDLPKIHKAGEQAAAEGKDIEQAVVAAITQYRLN